MDYRDRLETQDWAKLRANGDARRVPHLLVAFHAADPSERDEAWGELVNLVNHQGDIYSSTVATISVLLGEAAQSPKFRAEVLDFVARPAEYIGDPSELGVQLRQAICEGYSVYIGALGSDDEAEREVGAFILGNVPERSADSIPRLERMIATETAEVPLALAVWALGNLQSSPKVDLFIRLSQEVTLPLPRAVARAFLARWQAPNAPEEDTRAVADAVFERLAKDSRLPFGFLEDSLQSPLGCDLLQQIHSRRYIPRGVTPP